MRRLIVPALLVGLAACGGAPPSAEPPTPPAASAAPAPATAPRHALRLLFIGLDGADMDILGPLMAQGRCPALGRLHTRAAEGALLSPSPRISPLLWASIVTGRYPEDHGVLDFFAPGPPGKLEPVSSASRRAKSLWDILGDKGMRSGVVGFWATWPAPPVRGIVVSDAFAPSLFDGVERPSTGLVSPPDWERRLAPLREHPPDVAPLVAAFASDAPVAATISSKAATGRYEDPMVHLRAMVTATATLQAATRAIAEEGDVDALFVYHELIDEVCHRFMRAAPPPLPGVDPADAARFGRAVEAAYEMEDRLIEELLRYTDDRTVVVIASDHGFLSGARRPRSDPADFQGEAAAWHRDQALFMVRAPGLEPISSLAGSIYDVAPTVLALLSVPPAADMPGHALVGSPLPPVPSYGAPPTVARDDRDAAEELEKLRALGYVGPGASSLELSANGFVNLGLSLAARGKRAEAVAAYERALAVFPDHPMALYDLAAQLHDQGKLERALPLLVRLARLDTRIPEGSLSRLAAVAQELGPAARSGARAALDARPPARRDAEWQAASANLASVAARAGHTAPVP